MTTALVRMPADESRCHHLPVNFLKIKAKKKDQSYLYPANTAESLVCLSLGLILRCWLGINSFDVFFSFDIKKYHWLVLAAKYKPLQKDRGVFGLENLSKMRNLLTINITRLFLAMGGAHLLSLPHREGTDKWAILCPLESSQQAKGSFNYPFIR